MFSLISSGPTKGQEPNSSPAENRVSPFAPCLNRKLVLPRCGADREKPQVPPSHQDIRPCHPPGAPVIPRSLFLKRPPRCCSRVYLPYMDDVYNLNSWRAIQVAKLPVVIKLRRGRTKDWRGTECGKGCRQHALAFLRKTFPGAVYIC